jgi:hypothetical protein
MQSMGAGTEQREASDRVRIDGYDLPRRTGPRPETLCGPLHIRCAGHGDPKFLEQLVSDVLSWPHIEALPVSPDQRYIIPIRLEQGAASEESASPAFCASLSKGQASGGKPRGCRILCAPRSKLESPQICQRADYGAIVVDSGSVALWPEQRTNPANQRDRAVQ